MPLKTALHLSLLADLPHSSFSTTRYEQNP
jgi:hypothetical protein